MKKSTQHKGCTTMKVYEIEVVEVQHVSYRYFVEASSEAEAKQLAPDGNTIDSVELDIEQVSQRVVGNIISIEDIADYTHVYQSSLEP